MPTDTNRMPWALSDYGMVALGVTLMLTPLALWVAWTQAIFIAVLVTGVLAAVLVCVLVVHGQTDSDDRREFADPISTGTVTDEFVIELHKIYPMTHHHRRLGNPVFQRKMDRLKKFLRS